MTDKTNSLKDLELLIRCHYSIIFLKSPIDLSSKIVIGDTFGNNTDRSEVLVKLILRIQN